jgi:hypothetical protein
MERGIRLAVEAEGATAPIAADTRTTLRASSWNEEDIATEGHAGTAPFHAEEQTGADADDASDPCRGTCRPLWLLGRQNI